MSDLVTAPRPHPASLEKSHQPDLAHERHDDDSNPAALERSSLPAETATHAGRSSRWTKLVSRLPWAAASTVVLGFIAVVLWRIYAPSPDVWTDDAYVRVHYATIAPRVPGQVTSVRVDDNDTVKAGQVLAELDDRDYRTALEQAEAQVAAAQASVSNVDAQMSVQQAQINANQAQVDQAQANLGLARVTWDRDRPLVHEGWATAQQGTTDVQTLKAQQATVESARATLKLAQRQVEALKAQRDSAVASLGQAEAQRDQAKLNLSYTKILAPVDGMIAQRSVQVGNYVSVGAALMATVPLSEVYIEANYREVQLGNVRAGQRARIHVDAYNIDLEGKVVDVPAASGTTFATLQPDNATGNFTKIVQRLPIKIVLAPNQPTARLLRVGLSVEATIETDLADVCGRISVMPATAGCQG
jgi:membrane fusion protein (multidrug efflux system)